MGLDSITSNTKWIIIPWAIHFFFNIIGEEIYWHGYIMNRQFTVLGKYTWLVNAFFWFLVHLVWGWAVAIIAIPMIFIQTFIMQKTRNIWSGIFIHGFLGFIGDVATILGAFA
jgi:membrane protease YdiL (CAAX protease family)